MAFLAIGKVTATAPPSAGQRHGGLRSRVCSEAIDLNITYKSYTYDTLSRVVSLVSSAAGYPVGDLGDSERHRHPGRDPRDWVCHRGLDHLGLGIRRYFCAVPRKQCSRIKDRRPRVALSQTFSSFSSERIDAMRKARSQCVFILRIQRAVCSPSRIAEPQSCHPCFAWNHALPGACVR